MIIYFGNIFSLYQRLLTNLIDENNGDDGATATIRQKTKDALGFYVYALVDPDNGEIFYVGKASGDRPFDHMKPLAGEGKKADAIAKIRSRGRGAEPFVHILRHGLKDDFTAEEVEAAIIDTIGLENLTNLCRGKRIERGRITAEVIERRFGSKPVKVSTIDEPIMKIFINQSYSPTLMEQQLYDVTRQFWHAVGKEVREADAEGVLPYPTALAIVEGTVVMAYQVQAWFPAGSTMSTRAWNGSDAGNRWEFVGRPIPGHNLVGKSLVDDKGVTIPALQKGYGYIN